VKTFSELLASSMILSGFIVIMCVGTLCYLAVMGLAIPEVLTNICLIVVSFFFGTKAANTSDAKLRSLISAATATPTE
jgi:hypothetical protein